MGESELVEELGNTSVEAAGSGIVYPHNVKSGGLRFLYRVYYYLFKGPSMYINKKWVVPNQNPPLYFHKQFGICPRIDQCFTDDFKCIFEAEEEYYREKCVDIKILAIMRERNVECEVKHGYYDGLYICKDMLEKYKVELMNFFIKYGDLGGIHRPRDCLMKQKHRMVWERRNKKSLIDGHQLTKEELKVYEEATKRYLAQKSEHMPNGKLRVYDTSATAPHHGDSEIRALISDYDIEEKPILRQSDYNNFDYDRSKQSS